MRPYDLPVLYSLSTKTHVRRRAQTREENLAVVTRSGLENLREVKSRSDFLYQQGGLAAISDERFRPAYA